MAADTGSGCGAIRREAVRVDGYEILEPTTTTTTTITAPTTTVPANDDDETIGANDDDETTITAPTTTAPVATMGPHAPAMPPPFTEALAIHWGGLPLEARKAAVRHWVARWNEWNGALEREMARRLASWRRGDMGSNIRDRAIRIHRDEALAGIRRRWPQFGSRVATEETTAEEAL